jgi:hypothetical protein
VIETLPGALVRAASGNEQTYNVGIAPSAVEILLGEYALQCLPKPCATTTSSARGTISEGARIESLACAALVA